MLRSSMRSTLLSLITVRHRWGPDLPPQRGALAEVELLDEVGRKPASGEHGGKVVDRRR